MEELRSRAASPARQNRNPGVVFVPARALRGRSPIKGIALALDDDSEVLLPAALCMLLYSSPASPGASCMRAPTKCSKAKAGVYRTGR